MAMRTRRQEVIEPRKVSKQYISRYFEETIDDDPVTLQDIARAIGMSESKVRAEVLAGEIEGAFMVPYDKSPNPRGRWRIRFLDAQAYLYRLGAIRLPADHPIARANPPALRPRRPTCRPLSRPASPQETRIR